MIERSESELARVLVVDDEQVIRELLAESLQSHFRVVCTATGEEALAELASADFDVLLADQRMPGMSGVELAETARQRDPHLVSVLLSGYTDPQDIIAAINRGQIFRFVQKPWDLDELLLTLRQAAERGRLARENAALVRELERRLNGLQAVQEVIAAAAGTTRHPTEVLLRRAGEVLPYDLGAVLIAPAEGLAARCEIHAPRRVARANVEAMREQLVELFVYCGGGAIPERQLQLHTELELDPHAEFLPPQSQLQVPLRHGEEVAGAIILQRFAGEVYPSDAQRLLDLLANGTAEAVAKVRQRTAEQWHWLETALGALPTGVLVLDARGQIKVANAEARRLLADHGELDRVAWERLGWPEPGPTESSLGVEREITLGEDHIAVRGVQLAHQDARQAYYLVTLRVSDPEHGLSRGRPEMLATLSHEIRTPLASVVASLELLEYAHAQTFTDKEKRYFQAAQNGLDSLQRLLDALLEYEQYGRGGMPLRRRQIALEEVLEASLSELDPLVREHGASIEKRWQSPLPRISADSTRLRQVLTNLLGNACKHTPRGSRITVSAERPEMFRDWVVLGIRNTGTPIPAADLERIFDRFQRRTRSDGGQRSGGLGLAIARSIAMAHGGWLMADTGEQETVFWLALPIAERAANTHQGAFWGPMWLSATLTAADKVAAAAVLAYHGILARPLPPDPQHAAATRRELGDGFVLAIATRAPQQSHAAAEQGESFVAPVARIEAMGQALSALLQRAPRRLPLRGALPSATRRVLERIGFWPESEASGPEVPVLVAHANPLEALFEVAEQVSGNTTGRWLRHQLQRLSAMDRVDAFGFVRLVNLEATQAVYGSAWSRQLWRLFVDELNRVLQGRDLPADSLTRVASGVLVAGPHAELSQALADFQKRLRALLEVHYRREDRERGGIQLGQELAPLVSVDVRQFACTDIDAAAAAIAATPAAGEP